MVAKNGLLRKPAPQKSRKGNHSLPGPRRAPARHLFDCWPKVAGLLRSAPHLALLLDFDGTLVALRKLPSDTQPLDLPLRRILRRLAAHEHVDVYIISGRPLAQLRRLAPVRALRLLGLHGWEGREVPPLEEERRLLRIAKELLEERLRRAPGVWVEDKGLGLAVHYRGASPQEVALARGRVRGVLKTVAPTIHILRGHKLWELLPRQINGKGSAVSALVSRLPRRTLAIFVGDDTSDELAFKVLPRGLTIRVGKHRRTSARYFVRNPEEVKLFLLRLAAEIG